MRLTRNLKLIFCGLLLNLPLIGLSQDDSPGLGALITDRPDATEASATVTKGYLQVETGAFYESFEENSLKQENFTLNTTLIRLGILDNLELRFGWDFVEGKTINNGNTMDNISSGFSPLLLGTKIGIAKEKGLCPEIGFIGHLQLPFTAGNDYKPETTGVDFRFAFAHTLSEKSSLAYNLGAAWEGDNPEAAYIYTIAYGYGISEKIGAFAELYGDLPENNRSNHYWDAGITYLISDNFQLDASVGSSITQGQDILISGGISFRVPLKKQI